MSGRFVQTPPSGRRRKVSIPRMLKSRGDNTPDKLYFTPYSGTNQNDYTGSHNKMSNLKISDLKTSLHFYTPNDRAERAERANNILYGQDKSKKVSQGSNDRYSSSGHKDHTRISMFPHGGSSRKDLSKDLSYSPVKERCRSGSSNVSSAEETAYHNHTSGNMHNHTSGTMLSTEGRNALLSPAISNGQNGFTSGNTPNKRRSDFTSRGRQNSSPHLGQQHSGTSTSTERKSPSKSSIESNGSKSSNLSEKAQSRSDKISERSGDRGMISERYPLQPGDATRKKENGLDIVTNALNGMKSPNTLTGGSTSNIPNGDIKSPVKSNLLSNRSTDRNGNGGNNSPLRNLPESNSTNVIIEPNSTKVMTESSNSAITRSKFLTFKGINIEYPKAHGHNDLRQVFACRYAQTTDQKDTYVAVGYADGALRIFAQNGSAGNGSLNIKNSKETTNDTSTNEMNNFIENGNSNGPPSSVTSSLNSTQFSSDGFNQSDVSKDNLVSQSSFFAANNSYARLGNNLLNNSSFASLVGGFTGPSSLTNSNNVSQIYTSYSIFPGDFDTPDNDELQLHSRGITCARSWNTDVLDPITSLSWLESANPRQSSPFRLLYVQGSNVCVAEFQPEENQYSFQGSNGMKTLNGTSGTSTTTTENLTGVVKEFQPISIHTIKHDHGAMYVCDSAGPLVDYMKTGATKFAVAGTNRKVVIYDAKNLEEICCLKKSLYLADSFAHSNRISQVKFYPGSDGQIYITGSWDNSVGIWDCRSGKRERYLSDAVLPTLVGSGPEALDVNKHSILTGSYRTKEPLQLWDFGTCRLIQNIDLGKSNGQMMPYTCRFTRDGKRILVGGKYVNSNAQGSVLMFSTAKYQPIYEDHERDSAVWSVDSIDKEWCCGCADGSMGVFQ